LPNSEVLHKGKDKLISSIVNTIKPFLCKNKELPIEDDARIEFMVSQLYGLSKSDYETIYNTLNGVEDLLPVRALKRCGINDIFPD
ncbi:MAG: hypothetical protein ACLPT6_12210, partial [Desulfobaccales bacterium]